MAAKTTGKLKIGNNWNAITIIALSQNNPLKAIAEFVENSIDARAQNITIIRGKHRGETYLKIIDDGEGIDDFKYVATHIGDSVKRKLKKTGVKDIQGEFGIGLLSFWTVGDEISITSTGKSGITMRLTMIKNNPGYHLKEVKSLFSPTGTELVIKPLLSGIKQLSGEKIKQTLSMLLPRLSDLNVHVPAKGRRVLLRNTNTNIESVYIPSPIGFVGLSLKGTFIEERQHAAEILLSHILKTEYLWETVRMKGGAYGASASANGMEGIFAFSSYRDPKIIETVEAYREGLKYFCKHKPSENTVEQAIIAVVGKDVRPLSPGEKSIIGFRRVLYGIHDSLRRDKRRWLLETSPRDIMEAARRLLEQFDNSVLVILAGRESIMAASEKMPELPDKTVNLPQ